MTLRRTLLRSLIVPALAAAAAGSLLGTAALVGDPQDAIDALTGTTEVYIAETAAPDFDCRPYPAGSIPGHAVVTLPGEAPAYVSSRVGFAIWLGADGIERTGDERPGILDKFCK